MAFADPLIRALGSALLLAPPLVFPGIAEAAPPLTAAERSAIEQADAMPWVATINGQRPPGRVVLTHSSTQVLNTIHDGRQVRVFRGVRAAGTRAPIHVHPFGGWTCILSGQAVLHVEGASPRRVLAGECVDMPALRPMSNVNPGPGPAVMLDHFVTPPEAPTWRVVELEHASLGHEPAAGPATGTTR